MLDKYPVKINGIDHKIGAHGLPYWKDSSGKWVRTTKTVAQLEHAVYVRDTRIGAKVRGEK